MTTSPRVEFRQVPSVVRWNRVFCAVALLPLAIASVVGLGKSGWWFIAPLSIGVYSVIVDSARRTERIAIVTEDDVLIVTNFARTHRLRRDEIASVRIDRTLGRRWMRFEIRKKDGTGVFCDLMQTTHVMFRQSDASVAMCRRSIETWLRVGEH